MRKSLVWTTLVLGLLALAAAPVAWAHDDDDDDWRLSALSSPPTMVTGGNALVRLSGLSRGELRKARIRVNGHDVTGAFSRDESAGTMTGLVAGLHLGTNIVRAYSGRWDDDAEARLKLVNNPVTGPIFSGPQQQPFVCKTQTQGLGFPQVDNQLGIGMRLFETPGNPATPLIGWSKDCSASTVVDYQYRNTAGQFRPLPAGPLPADVAMATTLDGRTVPYVVRRERGTINRFIYSIAILAPPGDPAAPPNTSLWNGRLIYTFDGGVAIGHNQGTLGGGSHLYHTGLSQGYAIVHSSGTRTSTHYNLVLGAETAIMTKERFVEGYGVPTYTVGVGGSGGAIQQYVYAQRHPGVIIDAAIPQYSYPDMVTQTIHIGDCELLEYYMDVTGAANPAWAVWPNRTWLEGLNASATWPNPYRGGAPGSSECVAGWRGLTPLALNPLFGSAGAGSEFYDPAVLAAVKWTHWDDLRNIYGVGADGYARSPWDNVGVQYGLQALTDGKITPDEFLKLNSTVGSWKETKDMVQEGCPFIAALCAIPAQFDPWSRRNMRASPDGGVTPAPRREGNMDAARAAYTSGIVFRGDIDIPVIDWRHYLEHRLDMHNSHQSFASRKRMLNHDGRAGNQVIWFTDARPGTAQSDHTPLAFQVIDEWLANIRMHPWRGVVRNKPDAAVDSCFATNGALMYAGDDAWAGILDSRPDGPCTQAFPIYSTSRIVAGGPIEGGVFKCALRSVDRAIRRGVYGSWLPSPAEVARLEQIFPTGVCNYSKPDVGRPRGGDDDDD